MPTLGFANACRVLQHRLEYRLKFAGRGADHLEHVGGGGLLLQRFGQIVGALTQLVEQPRVLDGDDGLGGKVLHQLDLLVGERTHLLAEDSDGADQPFLFEHGYNENCARAAKIGDGNDRRISFEIWRLRSQVLDMRDRLRIGDVGHAGLGMGAELLAKPGLGDPLWQVVKRDIPEFLTVVQAERPELGAADARRILQHGVEHRLQVHPASWR